MQNLSANNVYFLDVDTGSTATGIKIVPNGNLAKDDWLGDLILVADGATSDVRYAYQMKKITVAGGVVPVGIDGIIPIKPKVTAFEWFMTCPPGSKSV